MLWSKGKTLLFALLGINVFFEDACYLGIMFVLEKKLDQKILLNRFL